ncbi:MAG: SusC/RagA family TonB-linked outer membrane protein [Gemmatimonadaceae bacterium]
MITMNRVRVIAAALTGVLLALPASRAHAQAAVITGKVTSEFGQPVEAANVQITELQASAFTTAQGTYTITIPAARVSGQQFNVRVRAIGYQPGLRPVTIRSGSQTADFALKQDINRLNEVVVTGSVEGTERSKVPFAVGRLTTEDLPVPALDPITALQGKVAGVRIAQTSGQPGSSPEILLRGPTSINATGRSQGPLIIVDGLIMTDGNFTDLGGLDIESVEVVKGAAGASLYGTKAASGVITIKTKRGSNQEGVRFNVHSEYGFSDLNSLHYNEPVDHSLALDETGTRFCVAGTANTSACSKTFNWNTELLRINNVAADTNRAPQLVQYNSPSNDGSLQNVYQSNYWPGQRYNTFAQVATRAPTLLNSIDATGKVGSTRFYVSGSSTDNHGAIKQLTGQQEQRARVNLDYDIRSNMLVSISTMYDKANTDNHGAAFGTVLRGSPAGSNQLLLDTLGRELLKVGGSGLRGTDNGATGFLYDSQNSQTYLKTQRFLGSASWSYFPAEWVTFDAQAGYDNRARLSVNATDKGYRTLNSTGIAPNTNLGNESIGNAYQETYNGGITATLRKQLTSDLNGKLSVHGGFDQNHQVNQAGGGTQFIVKDVFTLSNTSTNITATSSSQVDKNADAFVASTLDYKDRYVLDGTFRYDGSSRFGAGNRWAPFGRISGVWRVSEESWWKLHSISDFRIRASHGTAGNTPNFVAQYETYTCATTGCTLGQAGNNQLKPETTAENEYGTDFTLFNRLGVELTHATSQTKNQILQAPTPSALGFTSQWVNAGTLSNNTYEVGLTLPVITRRDLTWTMRGTWDRTRTFIEDLFIPPYFSDGGTSQGTGSFFKYTSDRTVTDGYQQNQFGNEWGRKFYKTCSDMPATVQPMCGSGKAYQVNDQGWVVWVGDGNSYKDGITKNLWQTKLSQANSPWNYPLWFGMPIVDRPLKGQPGEGIGTLHILGNALPGFRSSFNNTIQYKRLTLYGLIDGTFGFKIQDQGAGWGALDFANSYFDQAANSVESAKPIGYGFRVGGSEGAGIGGFYDILGPNNWNTTSGSYAKIREASATYHIGAIRGIGGDWSAAFIGRNLFTFTHYMGYDPETGATGGANSTGSGLINQVDAFGFPTLRTFTFNVSTRF